MRTTRRGNADYARGYYAGLNKGQHKPGESAEFSAGYRRGKDERYFRTVAAVYGKRPFDPDHKFKHHGRKNVGRDTDRRGRISPDQ